MQTNVIFHFLITKELFPLLKKSQAARIVNHSSMARLGGPLKMEYFGKNGGNLGGDEAKEETPGFRGPWTGYPDLISPKDLLLDESNINTYWDGCEKAVGKFEF